jgi:hypothetical protein
MYIVREGSHLALKLDSRRSRRDATRRSHLPPTNLSPNPARANRPDHKIARFPRAKASKLPAAALALFRPTAAPVARLPECKPRRSQ